MTVGLMVFLSLCGWTLVAAGEGAADEGLVGEWEVCGNANNTDVCVLDRLSVLSVSPPSLVLNWTLLPHNIVQTYTEAAPNLIASRVFPFNVYIGIEYAVGAPVAVRTVSSTTGKLTIESQTVLLTQQATDASILERHALVLLSPTCLQYTWSVTLNKFDETAPFVWFFSRANASAASPCPPTLSMEEVIVGEEQHSFENAFPANPPAFPPNSAGIARDPVSAASSSAFNVNLTDNWMIGDLAAQKNYALISLQGLANRQRATLYLTYPPTWDFTYTAAVKDYFANDENYEVSFQESTDVYDLLLTLQTSAKGYVVFDPKVRESLLVALTAAGVLDAVVVSSAMVTDFAETMGRPLPWPVLADFTGKFDGMTSVEIYTWAKEEYFDTGLCNLNYLVSIGGDCGSPTAPVLKPGVGDWGVSQRAFFADLSSQPEATEEYALFASLLSSLQTRNSTSIVHPDGSPVVLPPFQMGWHSYCKDTEHTYTTLASRYGATVHGLHSNPNLSFSSKFPLPEGYKFKNQHSSISLSPPASFAAASPGTGGADRDDFVYVTLAQTDGLGLGAWAKPGRGTLEYAWEVTLPDLDIQPALLRMFYEQATDKDYFVAGLSGPGYMYPKAVPQDILPERLRTAKAMMRVLDITAMTIFDASSARGPHTVTEDTNLTPEVAKVYFDIMCLDGYVNGFFNGYAPSYTSVPGVPRTHNASLISFEYYLGPARSVAQSILDLKSLAAVNRQRPYYLALHVREFSTVARVNEIIAGLPAEFRVVPYDVFLQKINANPNFRERYE